MAGASVVAAAAWASTSVCSAMPGVCAMPGGPVVAGLVGALKAHSKQRPIVGAGLNALANLSETKEFALRITGDEAGPLQLVMSLLKTNIKDPVIVIECYKALGALSRAEKNALEMAPMTLELLVQTFATHVTNPQVVAAALKFLANLCYHKECSEKVPATGVVGGVLGILNQHMSDPAVLVRGCKALENMAYGSGNVKDHMKREGVLQGLKEVLTKNAARDDVKKAAQAAIDALTRADVDLGNMKFVDLGPRLDKKKNAKDIFGKEEHLPVKVLSRDIRNFLNAGALLTKHSKTAPPRPKHVYVDQELKILIWKDPKDKALKEENTMKIFKIKQIDRGRCTPQLQRKTLMGKFLAKEECSFAVLGRDRSVDIECTSEAEREKWIHALETLIEFKKGQKLVASDF